MTSTQSSPKKTSVAGKMKNSIKRKRDKGSINEGIKVNTLNDYVCRSVCRMFKPLIFFIGFPRHHIIEQVIDDIGGRTLE